MAAGHSYIKKTFDDESRDAVSFLVIIRFKDRILSPMMGEFFTYLPSFHFRLDQWWKTSEMLSKNY